LLELQRRGIVGAFAMPKIHKSLKGQLLLDGGKLCGSFFHRTVLLVCEHTLEGAFGLVLNRPGESLLEEVFPGDLPPELARQLLFSGGPVQPDAMSYLHLDPLHAGGNVMDHLTLGHSLEDLLSSAGTWLNQGKLKVFGGYAGWSAGQLDEELRKEAWLVHPASMELIFLEPAENLWQHILRQRADWKERLLADAPEDLSTN
jgi:putative transcriptional regulator